MHDTLELIRREHPFRPQEKTREMVEIVTGMTLLDLRRRHFPAEIPVVIYLDGVLVPESRWDVIIPKAGSRVHFYAVLSGGSSGGGKSILRSILMLALVVAASLMIPTVFAKIAVIVVGGILINALLPPASNDIKDNSLDSQAYSWSNQNTQQQGVPVARWYGRHRVYGNIIASYLENVDDDQVMNCLISAGLGPVSSITDFKVNDQAASSYEDVQIKIRKGYLNQQTIRDDAGNAFVATKTEYQVNQKVEGPPNEGEGEATPRSYVTVGDEFDILEVEITFPNGVWHVDRDTGELEKFKIQFQVEVKRTDSETWIPLATKAADEQTYVHVGAGRWSLGKTVEIDGVATWWDQVIGSSDPTAHEEGDTLNTVLVFTGGYLDDNSPDPDSGDTLEGISSGDTATAAVLELLSGTWEGTDAAGLLTIEDATGNFGTELVKFTTGLYMGSPTYAYANVTGAETHEGCSWRWIENMSVVQTLSSGSDTYGEVNLKKTSAVRRTFKYSVPEDARGHYDVRVSKITEEHVGDHSGDYGQEMYFTAVREVFTDVFQYPRHALVALKAKATDQLSGSLTLSYMVDGAIVRIPEEAVAGAEVATTSGSSTLVTTLNDAFADIAVGDDIRVGNDQVTVVSKSDVDPDNILHVHRAVNWPGNAFTHRPFRYEWSNNPAWVALDVATQPVLAGAGTTALPFYAARFDGIDPARIDYAAFMDWADWCDELLPDDPYDATSFNKRSTFNGGFDYDTSLWEALLRVCQVARAVPVWIGMDLTLAVDREADPVNLYTVGNIEVDEQSGESNFTEEFLRQDDRANVVEIDYTDADEDYERTKMTVYRQDVTGNEFRASIDLFGVTNAAEAWRAGMYRLLSNRYLLRTITFEVDIEALNAMIGDVVYVQYDFPTWGNDGGGRVVTASADSVTLDKEVTIESGLTYKVLVRLSDDTLAERTVTNAAGSASILTVTPDFDPVPTQYDPYAFGVSTQVTRKVRIIQIEKSQDQKVKLTCIEYRPEVFAYDDELPGIPVKDTSTVDALKALQPTGVSLTQTSASIAGGRTSYGFTATWTNVVSADLARVEVWLTDKSAPAYEDWTFGGSADGETLDVLGLTAGMKYQVVLLPVDTSGNRLHVKYAQRRYSITISASTRAAELFFDDGESVEDHRTTVDGQVTTLDGQVSTLETTTSGLESSVSGLNTSVSGLSAASASQDYCFEDENGDLTPAYPDIFELSGNELTLSESGSFDPNFEVDGDGDIRPKAAA